METSRDLPELDRAEEKAVEVVRLRVMSRTMKILMMSLIPFLLSLFDSWPLSLLLMPKTKQMKMKMNQIWKMIEMMKKKKKKERKKRGGKGRWWTLGGT
jgi:hypothetical protein